MVSMVSSEETLVQAAMWSWMRRWGLLCVDLSTTAAHCHTSATAQPPTARLLPRSSLKCCNEYYSNEIYNNDKCQSGLFPWTKRPTIYEVRNRRSACLHSGYWNYPKCLLFNLWIKLIKIKVWPPGSNLDTLSSFHYLRHGFCFESRMSRWIGLMDVVIHENTFLFFICMTEQPQFVQVESWWKV